MISIYERSEYELQMEGVHWNISNKLFDIVALFRMFMPLFGISQDRKLRIRWFIWAIYVGG